MSKPIRITIRGQNADTDAPTVEDLLAQVGDWFAILQGVEKAMADDGASEIEWRVTGASKQSPLAFELTAFPRHHGVDIEQRTKLVKEQASIGIGALASKAERPSYFTDQVLASAERLFQRVTNGLDLTTIDFGDELPSISITPPTARTAANNTLAIREPNEKPYQEIGSIEGTLQGVELDGYRRPILYVKLRLDGETVKCVAKGESQAEVERHRIADVWKNQRVRVLGVIHYRALGRIARMTADIVQFLPPSEHLPSADDITDDEFTGGLRTEEYLERLRSGNLS
jgi:hypothetical protein